MFEYACSMAERYGGMTADKIPSQTRLADVATQMGAVCRLDLTSDVTHLFVGNISTPKYRYVAKERPDIKVLHPDWVDAVRQQWMDGDDVDVATLEVQYRLPTFYNLQVCVTGFEDHEQRALLADTVKSQGATYHGDLTRSVTHLIAAFPEGAKYTHAKQWGLNIVSIKWFTESVKRRMALDESLYDPATPAESQGIGAFRDQPKPRASTGKRERDAESQDVDDPGKRKFRRTASTRLSGHSQDLWQDMSAREAVRETSEDQWNEGEVQADQTRVDLGPSTTLSRASFRDHTTGATDAPNTKTRKSYASERASDNSHEPEGLFAGRYIRIHDFDDLKTARLQHFLEPNGACIVKTNAQMQDASEQAFFKDRYLLVPHAAEEAPVGPFDAPPLPFNIKIVTEWWVERCVHYKQVFDPSEDALSQPFWGPHRGLEKTTICTTGFPSVDFRQIAEAVNLMGAKYEEELTPSISVLISATRTVKKEKAFYALKHSIPIVSVDWLWACREKNMRVPFDGFEVQLPSSTADRTTSELSTSTSVPPATTAPKLNGKKLMIEDVGRKRLSNTRKRHATPSLPLQASAPSTTVPVSRPQPFVHEDDDDNYDEPPLLGDDSTSEVTAVAPPVSPQCSQPLQELSPNKSPRKSSRQSQDQSKVSGDSKLNDLAEETKLSPKRTIAPRSPTTSGRSHSINYHQPPPRPQHELVADLSLLVSRQMASRQDSAGSDAPQRRKSRPLGRSTSGIGNRSGSASVHSDNVASPPLQGSSTKEEPPPPCTQLGYETADAEMYRLRMNERMGIAPENGGGGERVAKVGLVKDSGGDVRVGSRARGKARVR